MQKEFLLIDAFSFNIKLKAKLKANSLLFLCKNGCFSADLYPQVEELLEQMASTIKTLLSYANVTDSGEELQHVSKKDILDA